MRLRITTKLFLAVLAMAAVIVAGMGLAAYWSLTRGFLGYVNGLSMQRLDETLPRIQAAYEEAGGWDFVREHPPEWVHLLMPRPGRPLRREAADFLPPPPPSDFEAHDHAPHEPSELTGAMLRWALLDEGHRRIAGYQQIGPDAVERPVVVGGRTVGYVAVVPFQSVAAAGAQAFERSELAAGIAIGAVALTLAALIAGWISLSLLRPVQRVARATGRLAAGEYQTRVEVHTEDEVGQLATDFNHLAATLERNADVRRAFFTDISHELRTPLAVLQGELEAMVDGVRPLTQRGVASLLSETRALSRLVGDLHDFALAGAGSLSYRMQATDVAALLQDTLRSFEARFDEHGLALQPEIPLDALLVSGDPVRLRQVFHNLLENCVRYTDRGGIVRVRAAQAGDEVVVEIQDSAPGVPEPELPLLFGRLYRAGTAQARKEGSGLGLAICRAVVEAHRGTIEALPSPLGGVRIPVRLPGLA